MYKTNLDLNKFSEEIYLNSLNHGWYDNPKTFGDIISLCHSELSEALEQYRLGFDFDDIYYCIDIHKIKKPEGIGIELADCILRILDFCGSENINIEECINLKFQYNVMRKDRKKI